MSESDPKGISVETEPISINAGPQRISAAFLARAESPVDDLIEPIDFTLADTQIGSALGVTTLPHLRELEVNGPHKVTGVSDTVSRRRVFICRPTRPTEEAPCAEKIVRHLATTAFRRPVSGDEVQGAARLLRPGAQEGRLRKRRSRGAAGHARKPAVHLPSRARAGRREAGADLSHRGYRSGVAAVLLPVVDGARQGAGRCRDEEAAAVARRARRAGQAHAGRTRAPRRWRRVLPRCGCACRISTRFIPTR